MKKFAFCVWFLLFLLPLYCLADNQYKLVIKKTGKIIEGKLISETADSIQILSLGLQISYKKDLLDLEKMKTLNADYGKDKEINITLGGVKATTQTQGESISDVARRMKDTKAQKPDSAQSDDPETAALRKRISDLEQEISEHEKQIKTQAEAGKDITPLTQAVNDLQEQLDSAKKELAARGTPAGKSIDDQIAELNESIEQTQKDLDQAIHDSKSTDAVSKLRLKLAKLKKDLAALQTENK